MANKSTRAEVQKRIRVVLDLLLKSTTKVDIVRFGVENWQVKERAIEDYITAAYAIMRELAQREREEVFFENLAQRRYLKNKAIIKEAYGLAHDIIKDEAKLLDLYPSEKHEHTGEIIQQVRLDVTKLADSELDAILNIAAKLGSDKSGEEAA